MEAALKLFQFIWPFFRRSFAGVVLAYVFLSTALGETTIARPLFYGAAGCWVVFQLAWLWTERRFGIGSQASASLVGVITFNLALTLVLAEWSLRFYAQWSGHSLFISDTLDAYKLAPGHDYGGGLRGNNFGFPGKDFVRAKRPGVRRLAVLGDSFAVGPAVPFADNFLTMLEEKLADLEVYNFGISATGPREYQAVLQDDVWQFDPDMVVVCIFVGNDITESLAVPRGMSLRKHALYQFTVKAWRLTHESVRQPVLSIASGPDQFPRPPLAEETFREIEARRLLVCQNPPPPGMEKKWQRALLHLEQIIRDCEKHHIPLGFILIPDEFQVNRSAQMTALQDAGLSPDEVDLDLPQHRLRAFYLDRGVQCLDLKPFFEGVPETYAPRDTHWNARGNRLAAEQIARWLSDRLNLSSFDARRDR
jgi:hypothetical protein